MNICVFGAASNDIGERFLSPGETLGRKLAERGHSLIFGGGNTGMMGAAARGMHERGGRIIGVAPSFFNVDGVLYPYCDEIIYTETMRQRKQKMEDMSDGFIVTPGGVGTFEEFFEILTLKQLKQLSKPIAILNLNNYYDPMLSMLRHAAETNFMSENNFRLFFVTDDIGEALDYIKQPDERDFEIEELRKLK